ncbi:MAG: hypothetical protein AB8B74_06930 [Crocinitomicaceae bacterium]
MNKKRILNIFILINVSLSVVLGFIVLFQFSINPVLIKSLFFFGFSSTVALLMGLLITECHTCPPFLEKLLFYIGLSLILCAFVIFFGLFGTGMLWHVIISAGIIYLLMVELQLLGWTDIKQSILIKITFAIALLSNLFLAYIFLFKVSTLSLKPIIFSASALSIISLFYGLYIYQVKVQTKKKG